MNKRLPLLLSLLGVILLAASLAYWVLQLYQPPQRPLAAVPQSAPPEPSVDAAATLFGGQVAVASAANYQLTGIVSAGRDSVAILIADNAPPKALKVGRELAPGVTLAEVHPRYVMLSDGGVMKRVDLPPDTHGGTSLGGGAAPGAVPPGAAASGVVAPAMPQGVQQAVTPAGTPAPQTVPEPPMSPGAVPQQPPQGAPEFTPPGEVGGRDTPRSQGAVQMPAPTQPTPATQ
jgi:general secretion pathway protein C